jgi:Leucine-rich repeat (LRR) protein
MSAHAHVQVLLLGANMPRLEELHLCFNHFSACPPPVSSGDVLFPELTLLNLEGNHIVRLADLAGPASWPSLSTLVVSGNRLSDLAFPVGWFPELETVSLNENAVASWRELDALSGCRSLHALRIRDNPVLAST